VSLLPHESPRSVQSSSKRPRKEEWCDFCKSWQSYNKIRSHYTTHHETENLPETRRSRLIVEGCPSEESITRRAKPRGATLRAPVHPLPTSDNNRILPRNAVQNGVELVCSTVSQPRNERAEWTTMTLSPAAPQLQWTTGNEEVDNFLDIPESSNLWHTANAWMKAIQKARGLDGPSAPTKFRAHDVWRLRPNDDDLFAWVIHGFDISNTDIYLRSNPNHPLPGTKFSNVIRQLFKPNESETYYATNMPIPPDIAEFRIPEALQRSFPCLKDHRVTINVTPQFTSVEPHIGRLNLHLVSLLIMTRSWLPCSYRWCHGLS
jgi:hypothetical protein